jgi:hypothetical protein
MPGDERLRQADRGHEVRDRGVAGREDADDPEAVHVGQGLVDQPELAQLLGLKDRVGDRAADVGAGRAQREGLRVLVGDACRPVGSMPVYINGG